MPSAAEQIREAFRDVKRASQTLLEKGPLAGAHGKPRPSARVPDLRTQPEACFRHFDRDGNGLQRHEVMDALSQTFSGADRSSVRDMVSALWPTFDTDGSGTISFREFNRCDGLRETLLAQMGGAASSPAAGVPIVQAVPVQAGRPSHAGGYPQPAAGTPVVLATPVPSHGGAGRPSHGAGHPHAFGPAGPPAGCQGCRPAPASQGVPKLTGRRKAVLVGINYFGTRAQLRGCINDVKNMQTLLTRNMGWNSSSIRTLTDDNGSTMPTRRNIEASLRWLTEGARPGDVLFFHYSGHGAQQEDPHGYEEDGMNETILPVDFKTAGMITDDQLGEILVKHLPEGVRLTAVMDCCHSGTGLDLPFTWTNRGWKEETNPYHSLGDVVMFSGCEDSDTSADATSAYGAAGGAMTTAFCDVLRSNPAMAYSDLMRVLNHTMARRGFRQRAQLTSSQPFGFDRPFLLDDIVPNSNRTVGRIVRRRFPPRPRKMRGPLADMLGIGAAVAGGLVLGDLAGGLLGALLG